MSERTPRHPILKTVARWILFGVLVFAIIYFVAFDLHRLFTIENLKTQQLAFAQAYEANPSKIIAIYFFSAAAFVVLCLPAASIVMMTAGALFGVVWGTVICSCALTLGAVLSLLSSRFIFSEFIERKFKKQAAFVNHGVEREGALFLATMRLLPMMPYFVTNLLLGLTKMRVRRFWWVSQLSSLPAIALYANAGTALANINSLSDIWSPQVFISLTLLAAFPFAVRACVRLVRTGIKRA